MIDMPGWMRLAGALAAVGLIAAPYLAGWVLRRRARWRLDRRPRGWRHG